MWRPPFIWALSRKSPVSTLSRANRVVFLTLIAGLVYVVSGRLTILVLLFHISQSSLWLQSVITNTHSLTQYERRWIHSTTAGKSFITPKAETDLGQLDWSHAETSNSVKSCFECTNTQATCDLREPCNTCTRKGGVWCTYPDRMYVNNQ